MDDEMIERCTLAAHNLNVADNPKINFETMPDHYKDTWRRLSIALIKAMREPTDKMISAGDAVCQDYAEAANVWPTMIDAILND